MFKHELGSEVITKVSKLKGILVSRCECLYGCNRYTVQPPADKDGKLLDGWWVDEEDIIVTGKGVPKPEAQTNTRPGGPMTRASRS